MDDMLSNFIFLFILFGVLYRVYNNLKIFFIQ